MDNPNVVQPARAKRHRSLRAFFEYDGRDVKLVSVQSLEMLAPPPQAIFPRPNEQGSWFELRDGEGRTLYRRVIENPIRQDIEVITDDPEHSLSRVAVETPHGLFFLIAPDIPQAREIVLVADRRPEGSGLEAITEPVTYRFDLAETGREGEN